MIKLYIKETKQLSEAELRAPDSFVIKLMDSIEKKYKEKYTKIDKQKKSLKEMTKYRKIFLKLKNSMSR